MRNAYIHFFYFIHDDFIVFIINVNEGSLLFCNPSAEPTSKIHQHLRRQDLPPVVTRRQVSDEQITCKTDSASPLSSSSSLSSHLTSILQINCTSEKKLHHQSHCIVIFFTQPFIQSGFSLSTIFYSAARRIVIHICFKTSKEKTTRTYHHHFTDNSYLFVEKTTFKSVNVKSILKTKIFFCYLK